MEGCTLTNALGVCVITFVCINAYIAVVVFASRRNAKQLKQMQDERRRLEYVTREYNRLYNDDYKPF